MILETIVATVDREGRPNFAPMGIDLDGDTVLLRPFRGAITGDNLAATGEGVVNFTDNVLLFARCAVSPYVPPHRAGEKVRAGILEDACSWKEFVVASNESGGERARIVGSVVREGRARDFLGFNRARHAVIEATILATRLHLTGREVVLLEIARLQPLVEKTGGPEEREAFDFIRGYVGAWREDAPVPGGGA